MLTEPSIASALLIRQPWIGLILDGRKTWEMRRTGTTKRGWIGLIESGSGAVQGVARLMDSLPPIDVDRYHEHVDKHAVPSGDVLRDDPYLVPWVLADARRLRQPVSYRHPTGAVIWVNLQPGVTEAISRQIDSRV